MEGMQSVFDQGKGREIEPDLAGIRDQLQHRIAGKKKTAWLLSPAGRWLSAASLLIVLAGSTYLLLRSGSRELPKRQAVAAPALAKPGASMPRAGDSSKKATASAPIELRQDSSRKLGREDKPEHETAKPASSGKTWKAKAQPSPSPSTREDKPLPLNKSLTPVSVTGYFSQGDAIRGRVIDLNNRPVSEASLTLAGVGTIQTDRKGQFSFRLREPDSSIEAKVHTPGYQESDYRLRRGDWQKNVIQLRTMGGALGESVGRALSAQNNGAVAPESEYLKNLDLHPADNAVPTGGWAEYRAYLNKNRKINTADSSIHGDEIVSIVLGRNGRLLSLRIEKSLSSAHDAEGIRLIREGPAWIGPKGKKARASVIISF
jgi:hypothetical protein